MVSLTAVFRFADDAAFLLSGFDPETVGHGEGWTAYRLETTGLTVVLAERTETALAYWAGVVDPGWLLEFGRGRVREGTGFVPGDLLVAGDIRGAVWSAIEVVAREWELRHGEHRRRYRTGPMIAVEQELVETEPRLGTNPGVGYVRSVVGEGRGTVTGEVVGEQAAAVRLWVSVFLQELGLVLSGQCHGS